MAKTTSIILGVVFLALGILGITGIVPMFTRDPIYVNIGEIVLGGFGLLIGIYTRQSRKTDQQARDLAQLTKEKADLQKQEIEQLKKENEQWRKDNLDRQQQETEQLKKLLEQQQQENERLRKQNS
ncbi:MAG: hypothetical protein JXB33_07435 [Clostridia bacterium]|nr:hypothetical protein [Clostridia bacterium]